MEDIYYHAEAAARRIETELRSLNDWQDEPLSPEKFIDMGAFGSNTMTFVQWLQFVLIPRINEIVLDKGDFPTNSSVATYAIREFDGRSEYGPLHDLLYGLDQAINGEETDREGERSDTKVEPGDSAPRAVAFGDTTIPPVLFTLAGVLPDFEGGDLENQLQTFDIFLDILSPTVRPELARILMEASAKSSKPEVRSRIQQAAGDVLAGGRASA